MIDYDDFDDGYRPPGSCPWCGAGRISEHSIDCPREYGERLEAEVRLLRRRVLVLEYVVPCMFKPNSSNQWEIVFHDGPDFWRANEALQDVIRTPFKSVVEALDACWKPLLTAKLFDEGDDEVPHAP